MIKVAIRIFQLYGRLEFSVILRELTAAPEYLMRLYSKKTTKEPNSAETTIGRFKDLDIPFFIFVRFRRANSSRKGSAPLGKRIGRRLSVV